MRRWKLFFPFFIIGMSALLMGNSQLQQTGLPLKEVSNTSILKKELSLKAEKNFENIILLPYSKYDEKEAAAIINRLNKLPQSLIKKIHQKGITLQLFTGKLTDNETVKSLAGVIPRGYQSKTTWDNVPGIGGGQTVLVKIGASQKGKGHGSVNLEYHELAHSIDSKVLGNASKTNYYLAIWNKEKFKLFPNKPYFQNYAEEYFSETFAMFYIGGAEKEHLKAVAPLTYQYISRIN
ncbi:anthrax toxin lethal factor-related metalloendopeptidase [Niallia nealsonii]|uniref:Toxin n=1 Tax=Niallia nealsonii TaxID=115979 RepID=A0A2N0Z3D6_9BACI|nr:toxin [Niallia nealsonii]PKG24032.1 toxin [Niallia nealsonii]